MASITANSLSRSAGSDDRQSGLFHKIRTFWTELSGGAAFNPYRPELHYMRGPGPAWHAKHTASTTQDLT
jgi:hypothetical protein